MGEMGAMYSILVHGKHIVMARIFTLPLMLGSGPLSIVFQASILVILHTTIIPVPNPARCPADWIHSIPSLHLAASLLQAGNAHIQAFGLWLNALAWLHRSVRVQEPHSQADAPRIPSCPISAAGEVGLLSDTEPILMPG